MGGWGLGAATGVRTLSVTPRGQGGWGSEGLETSSSTHFTMLIPTLLTLLTLFFRFTFSSFDHSSTQRTMVPTKAVVEAVRIVLPTSPVSA